MAEKGPGSSRKKTPAEKKQSFDKQAKTVTPEAEVLSRYQRGKSA